MPNLKLDEAMNSFKITFEPEGRRIPLRKGETILEATKKAGIGIRSECGGQGICGKCKVTITDKKSVSELTDTERKILTSDEAASNFRLACQAKIFDSLTVYIPLDSRMRIRRIQTNGIEMEVKIAPCIRKIVVTVPAPSLSDIRSDADRLLDSLKKLGLRNPSIEYDVLSNLPEILRKAQWNIAVTIWNNQKIIDVEPADAANKLYGMAMDIGTSKIAGQLVDLATGKTLAVESIENSQMVFGEDIITRINHAILHPKGVHDLQAIVIKDLNKVTLDACKSARISPENVYEMTVVGNTVMHHLFLGIQPKYMALAPFTPVTRKAMNVTAKKINLRINPCANIYVLPIIAGFVGGDNVADVLSTRIHKADEISLLLDIGTNTELTLGNKDNLISCSCASGPAFEGGHIKHGMKAVTGAIERVKINTDTLCIEYETIENAKPVGICGSGLVDIIAELLRHSLLSSTGRLNPEAAREKFREKDGIVEFVLVQEKDSGIGEDIVITQKDVRELQLAKAAIHTGCAILMKRKGVKIENIEKVFIAGAFGNYLNLENVKTIGLLPDVPSERVAFVGNAAISGARLALISRRERIEAEQISNTVQYLELSTDLDFEKEFISSIKFP